MSKAKLFAGKRWSEAEVIKGKRRERIKIKVPVKRQITVDGFNYTQLKLSDNKKNVVEESINSHQVAKSLKIFYSEAKPKDLWKPAENLIFKIRDYKGLDYLIPHIKKGKTINPKDRKYAKNTIAKEIPISAKKFSFKGCPITVHLSKADFDKAVKAIGDKDIYIYPIVVQKTKLVCLHQSIQTLNKLVIKYATLSKELEYFNQLCKDKHYPQIIKEGIKNNYADFLEDFQTALGNLKQAFENYVGQKNIPALIGFFQGKKVEQGKFTVLWQLAKGYIINAQTIDKEDSNLKAVIIDELYSICVMTQKLGYIHEFHSTKPNSTAKQTIASRLQSNHKHFGYAMDSNKDDVLQLIKQELTEKKQELTEKSDFKNIYQQYQVE